MWAISKEFLFQNLKSLNVVRCKSLTFVFPVSIAESLVKLELIFVEDCYMMKKIVTKDEGEKHKIVFPGVKSLHLENLFDLRSFYPASWILEWPSLRNLVLCWDKMKTFVSENNSCNLADYHFYTYLFNEKVTHIKIFLYKF